MCGCNLSSTSSKSYVRICGYKYDKLQQARDKMAILFNTTRDPQLKAEYKDLRNEIEALQANIIQSDICPDNNTITAILTEVENEYSNYYNP